MKKKVNLSDIELMLQLFGPKQYNLFIFDPYSRLIEDKEVEFNGFDENASPILVNLADEITCYKNMKLQEFRMMFDFGEGDHSDLFHQKKFSYINSQNGTMRWLFGKRKLSSVLTFYNTSSLRSKLIAFGIKIAHVFCAEKLIRNGKFTIYYRGEFLLEKKLRSVNVDNYSIFTGTYGYHRTPVIAIQQNNRTTHFAKIALNQKGVSLLQNEKFQLLQMNVKAPKNFIVPKVVKTSDPTILILSNETEKAMVNSPKILPIHLSTLVEVFDNSKMVQPLRETTFWDNIENNMYLINNNNKLPQVTRIKELLNQIRNEIDPATDILCSLSHSDFTPWNIKVNKDKLYLYDWELAKSISPALFDLFHFHFQNGIIVKKSNIKSILKRINASCENSIMKKIITTHNIDINLYVKLYLLRTISYYLATFELQKSLSEEQKNQIAMWEKALRSCINVSYDIAHRKTFVEEFYKEMRRTPHAMLKFTAKSLDNLSASSDLDIAILKADLPNIISYCKQHQFVKKARVVQKSFMATIELFFKDDSFLSIDLIHQFKRKGLQMMKMEQLLISATMNKYGVVVPDRRYDMEYALLFYSMNNSKIPEKYFHYFGSSEYVKREQAFHYLQEKYCLPVFHYGQLFSLSKDVRKEIKKVVAKQPFQTFKQRSLDLFNYFLDTFKSLFSKRGFIITLSGVDGVGKSTIVQQVEKQIKQRYRREVVLLRHRPGIFPILSAMLHGSKQKAEQIASVAKPRQGRNRSIVSSLIRFGYYYLDYIIGQVYIYFRYVLRGKIVLYDRYYFDFIIDSERTNIRLNKRFIKLLYVLILKPKLNILLWASPLDVYRRKQELEPKTIHHLSNGYKKLFVSYNLKYKKSTYKTIENVQVEQTVSTIMEEFAKVA